MFDTISIPVWLAVLLGLFGFIGLLDRIIGPGFRWFFRRKANRAIDELNNRLSLRIQPFKTTKRQSLIDQLLFDPEVLAAIEAHAKAESVPRDVSMSKATLYAREIVPAFNAYAYFKIGTRISRWLSKLMYRVRLGYADDEALGKIDPEATVVFVMNHRSNMDYVLVTYLASASATLSYAVGEWARIWLLQSLIRAMGAYFIRRESGNVLYRRVLARYVAMATRSGVTQAIFPEGGLTRDGLLREPKFGLLSYMIGDFDPQKHRDVVFVPVGLNYDRVVEDRVLTGELQKGSNDRSDFRLRPRSFFTFSRELVVRFFKGELYRYGYACASFGTPVSLKDWLNEAEIDPLSLDDTARFTLIEKFGRDFMGKVGDVVPVLPVALVASTFLDDFEAKLTELELKTRVATLIDRLETSGAHIHIPRMDRDYAIASGLRMLTLRHLVVEHDGHFSAAPSERALIAYYANSIRHLREEHLTNEEVVALQLA
ncbi:MAG: 1-acyl-sn-glycerol-3-phosphate acyltransferase [Rhizobiaceae bacterium]